jgi:hypothetical protein
VVRPITSPPSCDRLRAKPPGLATAINTLGMVVAGFRAWSSCRCAWPCHRSPSARRRSLANDLLGDRTHLSARRTHRPVGRGRPIRCSAECAWLQPDPSPRRHGRSSPARERSGTSIMMRRPMAVHQGTRDITPHRDRRGAFGCALAQETPTSSCRSGIAS